MDNKEIKRLIDIITPENIKEIVLDIDDKQENINKGSVDIFDLYLRLINKKELTAEDSKIYPILRPIILKNIEKISEFKFIEGACCMPDEIFILK
ncbi:MAG: hypothetical protein KAV97_01205 [Actinomycetia bacterium]|nr:hypothetical protein [Actinomycetes bacterium]